MNKFIGVGTLPRSGTLSGNEKKVLRFTLATRLPGSGKDAKERRAYVPCVLFKPSEVNVALLTGKPKGIRIVLEGRVSTSKFETRDGQTRYSTDVVVDERSIEVIELDGSGEFRADEVAENGKGQEW